MGKVMYCDCIEGMTTLTDNSIDMIFCDLPYGVTSCDWDIRMALDKLWEQYKRIAKDDSVIVLTATQPFASILITSNIDWYRHDLIWEKSRASNFFMAKKAPLRVHEHILVFCKTKAQYYPQMQSGKPYKREKTENSKPRFIKTGLGKDITVINNGTRYPRSVLYYPLPVSSLHATQKPLALVAYLIQTYSKPGALVLDNCVGSGTTAIAALQTGRDYIVMDITKDCINITNRRIAFYNKHGYDQCDTVASSASEDYEQVEMDDYV